jgi:hypothetical protein
MLLYLLHFHLVKCFRNPSNGSDLKSAIAGAMYIVIGKPSDQSITFVTTNLYCILK